MKEKMPTDRRDKTKTLLAAAGPRENKCCSSLGLEESTIRRTKDCGLTFRNVILIQA